MNLAKFGRNPLAAGWSCSEAFIWGLAKRASQQFRNPIARRLWSWSCRTLETRAKFGPWPPETEAAAVLQPLATGWSPAVSKPYRKEVLVLKGGFGFETRLVDLAKFGSGHPELKLKEFRNPWQRAEVAPKLFSVSEPYTNYRKAVLELKLQHFKDPIETLSKQGWWTQRGLDPGRLELKLQQFRQTFQRAEAAAKFFRAERPAVSKPY